MRSRDFAIVVMAILVSASAIGGLLVYFRSQPATVSSPIMPVAHATSTQEALTPSNTFTANCDSAHPISLVSVSYSGSGSNPTLQMSWSNCSSQALKFNVQSSFITMTLLLYGRTSTITGYLYPPAAFGQTDTTVVGTYSLPAHGSATVTAQIMVEGMSPNASVQGVKGTLTAVDPATGQAISIANNFTV